MKKDFLKCALIRAARTFLQTAAAMVGTGAMASEINGQPILTASTIAAALSILTSLTTGLPEVDKDGGNGVQ